MMNGVEFIKSTDGKAFYIEACLKCIIYGYFNLIAARKNYSRSEILRKIKSITGSEKSLNEIEDFLCEDLVKSYIKPNKHLFGLKDFAVYTGGRETLENVKVGILDIKFELPTLLRNHYYIFEAKRLDKYSKKQKYYIDHGIARFTNGQYYSESEIVAAGMLAFVEVDLVENPKGKASLGDIQSTLNKRIKTHETIESLQLLEVLPLHDDNFPEFDEFGFAYLSRHIRKRDRHILNIYHVFLDYYSLLTS